MKVEDTLFESLDNIESPENVAKKIKWLKEKNGFINLRVFILHFLIGK